MKTSLAAISQQTSRMRPGHAAVLAPARFNHPIRAAGRAAMLDHLSGGRLEFGLGIDRLMAFHQVGSVKHADVMRSLHLPEFDK